MNLRVVAVFPRLGIPKAYPLLYEQVVSMLLETEQEILSHMRYSTLAMIKEATPASLPHVTHRNLNRDAQLLQPLGKHSTATRCARPPCSSRASRIWYNIISGLPHLAVICANCYNYERRNPGERRTAKMEMDVIDRRERNILGSKLKKPANGKCPRCKHLVARTSKSCSTKAWVICPPRRRWECLGCSTRAEP